MSEHWTSGLDDIRASFANPDWFEIPTREQGFVTHNVHREAGSVPASDRTEVEMDHRPVMPLAKTA